MNALTLRGGRAYDGADPIDVVLNNGRIAAIRPTGGPVAGEVVDLDGRFVGPGLWDAHVHFTQWVISSRRVDVGGTNGPDAVIAVIRGALAADAPRTHGVLVGYGYRDGLWSTPTSLLALDEAFPDDPVVLVSGDLHAGWMNTRGAERLGLRPDASGVVAEFEWIAALQRFQQSAPLPAEAYAQVAEAAARRGVVGVVEYENVPNHREWPERVAAGVRSLRVDAAVWPDRLEEAISLGLRTGDRLDPDGLVRMGRLKIVVDGSLNTRTAWCWDPYPGADAHAEHGCGVQSVPVDELRRLLQRAKDGGILPAVHAIGDRANTEVIDVFQELGMPGIIEHAQLVRDEDFARFRRAGLIASIQPEHAMDDRDIADLHWAGRTARAFAFGSLHRSGAALRLGSDAPVAPLDPWHAIASGTARSRGDREAWHPEQRLPLDVALEASSRSRLDVGQPADLVVVERDPYSCDRDALREMPVAATLLGGRFTYRAV
ncbi:amidohydrolase family protein [Microbacterium sp. P26]|uniref:amidohydrolase n=1 Tax=Microbacterium TaxID=33882 RepID=UPI00203ADF98|nr:amidohydrolase family protein [Microbacterium sp. P26]MCM3502103.1 amidohydrolase family protein [Microbacterium sp. P26]